MSREERMASGSRHKSRDEHPPLFMEWSDDMESAEMNVHPEDRVYLVISRLQRVRKARGKLGFLENISSTINGITGGSINATRATAASSAGMSGSSTRPLEDGYAAIGQDITDALKSLKSFFKSRDRVLGHYDDDTTKYSTFSKSSSEDGRRRQSAAAGSTTSNKHERESATPKSSPSVSDRDDQMTAEKSRPRGPDRADDGLLITDTKMDWREELSLTKVADTRQQDQLYWAKQRPRHYGGSSSSLEHPTKGIAQCHWAIEYRGRYFELQVRKLPHAYQMKEFAFFSSVLEAEEDEREVTARIYAGCSHMSCEVMDEIGKGIMKTQPVYELRSDNCQQFIAVFLPRILCSRHPYMPCLPCGSVPWAQKYTTFPTYVVGIRQGELTVIDHRYYTVTSGLNMLLKHFDKIKDQAHKDLLAAWHGKPQIDFQSTEISKYTFRLQGDDPSIYLTCRPIRYNPYLLVHREHQKTDIRPLGNHDSIENDFHLWSQNRPLRPNRLLDQLEQAVAVQNGKKLLGSLDLFKTQMWRDIKAQMDSNNS